MVTVLLTAALICFNDECYPALVGKNTPIGNYTLVQKLTTKPGYGGDILQYHETKDTVLAIHRLYLLNPKQQREKRIQSNNPKDRVITAGCINVTPEVYKQLVTNKFTELVIKN